MAFERVERRGFKVSMDNIKSFTQYLDSQQREVWAALSPLVPDWFSPESDPDRRRLLFQDLGLPVLGVNEETQNEVADDAVLEALCQDFPDEPVLPLLRRWNKLSTMRERYGDGRSILVNKPVKGLVQHICHCGRVHATYNMDVARTGRLSCSDPALHGWTSPSRDPEEGPFYGRMCRDEFTCDPGNVIIQADYRQLEYFIAAMLFDDPLMQKYCAMGVDPHTEAAKIIRHLFTARPWEQLSDKEKKRIRSYAKTIVFAQLYGQGIPALARRLGCSKKFAEDVAAALFGQFPTLMRNIQKLRQQVEREGGVYTWWDGKPARWRPLYEAGVQGSDKWSTAQRAKAARAGVNTPVQGTANEFCVASVVALVWAFAENGIEASVVGSIHDSVIVESSVKDARTVIEVMQDVMTGWPSYSPSGTPVKLGVDIEVGLKWGSLKAWEPDKGLAGMGLSL
jgi:DNA polymerase-1